MLSQKNLNGIINKCDSAAYENAVVSGLAAFIENCSDSILKKKKAFDNNNLNKLLYLMKFLYQNWAITDRETRAIKQLCLKVLYIILILAKGATEWRQLLEQAVKQTGKSWNILPDKYPFLVEGEKDKIFAEVDAIMIQDDIDSAASSFELAKNAPESDFYYDLKRTYDEFFELHQKFRSYTGPIKKEVQQLKAFFVAVKRQNITKEFPGILKILPLDFCKTEILSLLSQISTSQIMEPERGFLSVNNATLEHGKKMFVQSCNEGSYDPVPIWADWFFVAGKKAAIAASAGRKLVVGFSLPTRAYAVLFFLLGHETWRAEKMMEKQSGNDSYFNYLSKCQLDEALLIRESGRWKRCWFKGVETATNQKFIKVKVPGAEKNRHVRYVHGDCIATLRKAVDPDRKVATNQIGFQMTGFDPLPSYYNKSENEILQFLNMNNFSHVVIGNMASLKKEIDREKIYFLSDDKYHEMSFQDIIRFKNFMTDFDLFRGTIIGSQKGTELPPDGPEAVIYDGSLAYLNHQGDIQSSIEAVFLDRTEAQFSNACGELMSRYYDREEDLNLF